MATTTKLKRRLALKKAIVDHYSLSYNSDPAILETKLDNEESIISAATELITKITVDDPRYDRLFRSR